MTIEQLYEQYIKSLPVAERLQLITLITHNLTKATGSEKPGERSLLELEGLGAELWAGIEAQEYVNKLRQEWEHRP